jgi:selenocysteine lyase/cysteine desulfurase
VCRDRGIFLAVDATQAVGVMPVDAAAPGVSLLTSASYKWLLGPYGGGFGYLAPEWAERIEPSYLTWTAAEGAENFNALPRDAFRWVNTARRFDGPEAASFLNTTGMARSAEFIAEIGRDAIHAHVTGLLAYLEETLPAPFRRRASPSPVPGPILMIEADDTDAVHGAYRRLRARKIWVSLRDDGIRVSPHIYNTREDMDRLLGLLASG